MCANLALAISRNQRPMKGCIRYHNFGSPAFERMIMRKRNKDINLSNINIERIQLGRPAKAHMQEPRTIQLIRSIDRLDLQARRRRVKGKGGMNLSLLSDTIEYRRENATFSHRHHHIPTFSVTSVSAIKKHVRMICIRMPHKLISPSPSSTMHNTKPPRRSPHLDSAPHPPTRTHIGSELPTYLTDVTPPSCTPLARHLPIKL